MKAILMLLMFVTTSSFCADVTFRQLGTEEGRFVFGDMQNDEFFMLDTKTGRLWKMQGNSADPGKLVPVK